MRAGIWCISLVAMASRVPASPPLRMFAVDKASSSLFAVEIESGAVLARGPIPALPDAMIQTADRSRLLLLERGKGQRTSCCGFNPEGKSAVSILDSDSLKIVARFELGWGLNVEEARLSPDGRRVVLFCPGYRSQVPSEARPQEIVVVDGVDAALVGRLPLERRSDSLVVTPDGKTGLVHFRKSSSENRPAEILVVDLARATVTARVELDGDPSAPLVTPSGEHAVFYAKGRLPGESPGAPASLQVLPLPSAKPAAPLRLDLFPTEVIFGTDGTRMAFFAPRREQRKAPVLPAAVQLLDVPGARLFDVVTLEGAPGKPSLSPDGRQLLAFTARQDVDKRLAWQASLRAVDMLSGVPAPPLLLDGAPAPPFPSPDGLSLYLLDRGLGRLHVTSPDGRPVAALDVGANPQLFVDKAAKRVWVLSDGGPAKAGRPRRQLRLVTGAQIVATVDVPPDSYLVVPGPSPDRLYVVGLTAMAAVDTQTMSAVGEAPLGDVGQSPMRRLEFSRDGRRAVASFAGSDRLSVFDTTSLRLIGSPKTGRGGVRVLKKVGATAIAAVALAVDPVFYAGITYRDVDFILAPDPLLVINSDGLHAYAVNRNTNDVTIVSTQTGDVVRTIGENGALRLLPGGGMVAIVGPNALHLIDGASNEVSATIVFSGTRVVRFAEAAGSQRLLAFGGDDIYCLHGPTGNVVAHIGDLKVGKVLVEGAQESVGDEQTE